MSDYLKNVQVYAPNADEAIVADLVKRLAVVLKDNDAKLVATSDPAELERIVNGFAKKRLGLDQDAANEGIAKVTAIMKSNRQKSRVTFYYLLAQETNTLDKLR